MSLVIPTNSLFAQKIKGNGTVVKQDRTITSFKSLLIEGACNVIITQGAIESISIEADDNIQKYILTENSGNNLTIKLEKGIAIESSTKMNVYLTIKNIDALVISGIGNVECTTPLLLDRLNLIKSGAGNTKLYLSCSALDAIISGVGSVKMIGHIADASINISGAGSLKAYDLIIQNLKIKKSGVCNVHVFAEKEIDIETSGTGDIYYKGNAKVKNLKNDGVGVVKKM